VEAGVSVEVTSLAEAYDHTFHTLYEAVLERASVRFEHLTPLFFQLLGRAFGDSAPLLVFRRRDRVVGWVAMLLWNDTAYDLFHGIDYAENEETALYFNQLAAVVRVAIERRARRLSLGQSTETAKARFGARAVPLWIGLQHRRRAVTSALRAGQGVLFPDHAVPERHVFKP
jgi:predicted N-acyltransferase